MELRLKTFYQSSQGPQLIDLFGYSTRGMPSLEVYAHPRTSKVLKEKILFLTKARKMQLPPRRYVLCMDLGQMKRPLDDFGNFELPFLLLFWSLAKALPIKKLDDCVCMGEVHVDGLIISKELSPDHIHLLHFAKKNFKIIDVERKHPPSFSTISLMSLMKTVQNIRVQG